MVSLFFKAPETMGNCYGLFEAFVHSCTRESSLCQDSIFHKSSLQYLTNISEKLVQLRKRLDIFRNFERVRTTMDNALVLYM